MRRILATDFGIWPAFKELERISDGMVSSPKYWTSLANYLLLYDQIVIPTGNLQILPVLRLMLGEEAFDDVLRNKGIVLARFDQWMCYAGNGAGLKYFKMQEGPDGPRPPNLGTTFFKPLEQTISDILSITTPPSSSQRRSELSNLLIDNVVQLPIQAFVEGLKEESYKDILGSPYLRDFLALRNTGRSLDSLIGIAPNEVKIFNPHLSPDTNDHLEIGAVLRVAFENFLLCLGGYTGVTEVTGDDSTLTILRAKGQRLGYSPDGDRSFAQIQEIGGLPNLGEAFAAKQLSAAQLLDLRYSPHSQVLRDWFAAGAPNETADETVRRYIETVGKPSWIEALPTKILRFATTTGIGVIEPLTGAVVSALDTFLLSKWFPGKSPRLFLKQAKVMLENKLVIAKPIMRGRDRNTPCSCGSGKKFKKCCGVYEKK
jgi:hypothetical protein